MPRRQLTTLPSIPSHGSVLVLLAHPARHRSRVNAAMVQAISDIPGVTIHDLYEAWPEFVIDGDYERALLLAHDQLVFQHPIHWYSAPALLKAWQEQVLTIGWAYGPGGTALRGKHLLCGVTTGGPETAYTKPQDTLATLLRPVQRTAITCGMTWMPPFAVHGAHRLDAQGIAKAAARWREALIALCNKRPSVPHG